jgi:hypothetical protein
MQNFDKDKPNFYSEHKWKPKGEKETEEWEKRFSEQN